MPNGDLLTLCAHLYGSRPISQRAPALAGRDCAYPDLRDVAGQQWARRAIEIAASGNHDLLLVGPPGTGKTLLASRLPGILPPPRPEEALTLLALAAPGHGIAALVDRAVWSNETIQLHPLNSARTWLVARVALERPLQESGVSFTVLDVPASQP